MNISGIEENNSSENEIQTADSSPAAVLLPENNSETADSHQNASNVVTQSTEVVESAQIVTEPTADENEDKWSDILANFTAQLKESNRLSKERESVIDRLHEENQRLKHGEIQQALLPVFRDLIRLYDDLSATISRYTINATGDEKIVRDLNCFKETIGDILYRYGVEPVEVEAGSDFNPKEHKAVGVAQTNIASEDRKIWKIIRDGFKTETRIIRNAEVEVYRFSASSVETVESPATEVIEPQNENNLEIIENPSEAQ